MPTGTFFNSFKETVAEVINLGTDTFKLALTNTLPVVTNSVFADITEIAAGNGYTAGGVTLTTTSSTQSGGTYRLILADSSITASGGSIGPFRYAVLYDDTPTSPADPLMLWYDINGTNITLTAGNALTIDFDGTNGVITITG